jgi:hypothetical protein
MRSGCKRGDQDTNQKSHVGQKYGESARNVFPLYEMDHFALGRRPFGGSCKMKPPQHAHLQLGVHSLVKHERCR